MIFTIWKSSNQTTDHHDIYDTEVIKLRSYPRVGRVSPTSNICLPCGRQNTVFYRRTAYRTKHDKPEFAADATSSNSTAPHRTAPHRTSSRWSAPSGFTNIYHDLGSVLLRGALETSLPCSSPLLDSSSGKKPRQGNVYFAEDLNRYGSTVVSFYSTNRRHNVYHKTFKQWLLRLVHERKVTRYA